MTLPPLPGATYCVFQRRRAGDFLLHVGLFNAIKDYDPTARLTVVAGRRAQAIAECHPAIDRVLLFDASPVPLASLLSALLGQCFDVWIDPKDGFSRSSLLFGALARARIKVGINGPRFRPFNHPLAPPEPGTHLSRIALRPLAALGLDTPRLPRLTLGIPPASRARVATLYREAAPWTVLVNVSAGHAQRYWGYERWAALISRLAAVRPTTFFLSADPADYSSSEAIALALQSQGLDARLVPMGSLLDVAAVVERADVSLSADTAIVHLASVLDRPIVGLYLAHRPTLELFGPLSRVREIVVAEEREPMSSITVDRVEEAYARVVRGIDDERSLGAASGLTA